MRKGLLKQVGGFLRTARKGLLSYGREGQRKGATRAGPRKRRHKRR